jgi:hypothetical protein
MATPTRNRDLFWQPWGTPVEIERRRRIRLSVWAYAYEIVGEPIVEDWRFDIEAYASDPTIITGRLDDWWRASFQPFTGQWIHSHPETDRLTRLYRRLID